MKNRFFLLISIVVLILICTLPTFAQNDTDVKPTATQPPSPLVGKGTPTPELLQPLVSTPTNTPTAYSQIHTANADILIWKKFCSGWEYRWDGHADGYNHIEVYLNYLNASGQPANKYFGYLPVVGNPSTIDVEGYFIFSSSSTVQSVSVTADYGGSVLGVFTAAQVERRGCNTYLTIIKRDTNLPGYPANE